MAKLHARLSPSSADRWTSCTASPAAQDGIMDTNSDASRQGTTCHQIQEEVLLDPSIDLQSYLGRKLIFWVHPESDSKGETWDAETLWTEENRWFSDTVTEAKVEVTQAMINAVESAVTYIREQHTLLGGRMLVEQRVPIGQFTGEEDARGSADVILMGDDWIHVMDSKFGRKKVYAVEDDQPEQVCFITGEVKPATQKINRQMACYALGAIHEHDTLGMVEKVTMTIVQPFVNHTDSYTCSIGELREVEAFLRQKAEETRTNPVFKPTQSNCHFCRAKGTCQAQTSAALTQVFDGFGQDNAGTVKAPAPATLGSQYALLGFVRGWADAVEAAVRNRLENGEPVVRDDGLSYKLVEGRAGARKWIDEEEVAAHLKAWRFSVEDMYNFKLISPAELEKFTKAPKVKKGEKPKPPKLGPRQWENMQALTRRGETAKQIVLNTDSRPQVNKADGFEDVDLQVDKDIADLFGL